MQISWQAQHFVNLHGQISWQAASGELEAENWRLCSTTLVRGVMCELEAENWRHCSTTLVRGVSGKLDDENWRLCSTTLVRGAICAARS